MDLQTYLRKMIAAAGVQIHRQAGNCAETLAHLRPHETEHALIRLGGDSDGGYLVPDDLDGIAACFSPGVDKVATFEKDCIERGMRTFQIDASVEHSPLVHPNNKFERKYLGIETFESTITLDDWVNTSVQSDGDLILQMDIEGHEWLTLAHVSDVVLSRFRIIVLELHFLPLLMHRAGDVLISPVIQRLKRKFKVVHLHVNNAHASIPGRGIEIPPYVEVTLLRRDRFTRAMPLESNQLPHALDRLNIPDKPAVPIPFAVFS